MTWLTDDQGKMRRSKHGVQLAEVVCRRSEEDFGFVTKNFIEKERMRDFDDAFEVKRYLRKMGIIPQKEKNHANCRRH